MWCYRRHGHNEGDDPSYTQPLMYKAIAERRSVRKLYVEALVKRGDITLEEAEQALADFQDKLQVALDETRAQSPGVVKAAKPPAAGRRAAAHRHRGRARRRSTGSSPSSPPTPSRSPCIRSWPASSTRRSKLYAEGEVEWATAESLAIGSLLLEGHDVRLAGEDTRRGTFSQRHAALTDYDTGKPWIPLEHLEGAEGTFWVYDSLLSEFAALGFEYGYAQANPHALVDLGGPVRRLRQRRPGDPRPVPRRRRGQVGPEQRARPAPAPRLRGAGAGALVGADRALPHRRRRGQHPGVQRDDGGAVLPPAAPAGPQRAPHARSSSSPPRSGCG